MQRITIDLAPTAEVHRANGIDHARRAIPGGIYYLPAMAGVMQKVARSRLAHEPVHSRKNIVACGVIRPWRIVAEDYLRTGITGESSVGEKFSDVLDVLVAAAQLILTAGVVDANEEGFLANHG